MEPPNSPPIPPQHLHTHLLKPPLNHRNHLQTLQHNLPPRRHSPNNPPPNPKTDPENSKKPYNFQNQNFANKFNFGHNRPPPHIPQKTKMAPNNSSILHIQIANSFRESLKIVKICFKLNLLLIQNRAGLRKLLGSVRPDRAHALREVHQSEMQKSP